MTLLGENRYLYGSIGLVTVSISLPFAKHVYDEYLSSHIEKVINIIYQISNFSIGGYYIPWRYLFLALFIAGIFIHWKVSVKNLSHRTLLLF